MIIRQRDIVEIAFYTGRKPETHPALVVSTDEIYENEGFFYAILLSTKNLYPDFTYEIKSTMVNNPLNNRDGFAVCHMVQQFYTEDVITRTGASLKLGVFKNVISKIKEVVFGM